MIEHILLGSGFAFVAAIQPGPLQAYLLSSVSRHGWKRTLPAAFSPLISDGPIALIALLLLRQMPAFVNSLLQSAGGIYLMFLGWGSYREWRRKDENTSDTQTKTPSTIFQAALVNLLNPNPYIGWSLVLGPAILSAWQQSPLNGLAVLISFYGTIITMLAATIILFGTTSFLGRKGKRILTLLSAIILFLIGIYLLISGIKSFLLPGPV